MWCLGQTEDRFSPAWWFADVPGTAIIPLRRVDAVLPYLRQVGAVPLTALFWTV